MPKMINWNEPLPNCDFCDLEDGIQKPALYDGKTKSGPWGNMCEDHLVKHGYPLSEQLTFKRYQPQPYRG
jgi:hypothetical protein